MDMCVTLHLYKMKKITKQHKIKKALETLDINDSLDKDALVITVWGEIDYFIVRSFDVTFTKAKKELEGKRFRTFKGVITRIK